jgi:hypothetical protein
MVLPGPSTAARLAPLCAQAHTDGLALNHMTIHQVTHSLGLRGRTNKCIDNMMGACLGNAWCLPCAMLSESVYRGGNT